MLFHTAPELGFQITVVSYYFFKSKWAGQVSVLRKSCLSRPFSTIWHRDYNENKPVVSSQSCHHLCSLSRR